MSYLHLWNSCSVHLCLCTCVSSLCLEMCSAQSIQSIPVFCVSVSSCVVCEYMYFFSSACLCFYGLVVSIQMNDDDNDDDDDFD